LSAEQDETMSDRDELLALANELDDIADYPGSMKIAQRVRGVASALRAALTARPQPLFEGTIIRYGTNGVDRWIVVNTDANVLADLAIRQGTAVVVYAAGREERPSPAP